MARGMFWNYFSVGLDAQVIIATWVGGSAPLISTAAASNYFSVGLDAQVMRLRDRVPWHRAGGHVGRCTCGSSPPPIRAAMAMRQGVLKVHTKGGFMSFCSYLWPYSLSCALVVRRRRTASTACGNASRGSQRAAWPTSPGTHSSAATRVSGNGEDEQRVVKCWAPSGWRGVQGRGTGQGYRAGAQVHPSDHHLQNNCLVNSGLPSLAR